MRLLKLKSSVIVMPLVLSAALAAKDCGGVLGDVIESLQVLSVLIPMETPTGGLPLHPMITTLDTQIRVILVTPVPALANPILVLTPRVVAEAVAGDIAILKAMPFVVHQMSPRR